MVVVESGLKPQPQSLKYQDVCKHHFNVPQQNNIGI